MCISYAQFKSYGPLTPIIHSNSKHTLQTVAADPRLKREKNRAANEKKQKEEEKKKAMEEKAEKERVEREQMEAELAKKKVAEGMSFWCI